MVLIKNLNSVKKMFFFSGPPPLLDDTTPFLTPSFSITSSNVHPFFIIQYFLGEYRSHSKPQVRGNFNKINLNLRKTSLSTLIFLRSRKICPLSGFRSTICPLSGFRSTFCPLRFLFEFF